MKKDNRADCRKDREDINIKSSVSPDEMELLSQSPFWSTLWKFAKPYRKTLLAAAFCAVIVGICVPLQMQFSAKWIIDSALERSADTNEFLPASERFNKSMFFVGLFVLFSGVRMLVWIAGWRRMLKSIEGMLFRIRSSFFNHVQKMCFRFHDQLSSGELFNYIMGMPINSIKQFLQQFSMAVPYQIVGWVFTIGLLASFNLHMTVITVSVVIIVVFINYRSNIVIREVASDFMKLESVASRHIADMLRGSRAIKTYAMEDNANNIFTHHIVKMRDQGFNLAARQQIEQIKPESVQYAGLALIMGFGVFFLTRGEMTTGTFTAFVLSFNQLMQPLMAMLRLNLIRANADSGLDRIMRVLQIDRTTPEPAPDAAVSPDEQALKARGTPDAGIKFEDVSFAYDGREAALKDCSCQIGKGESIALVGPSGSGKTTFISLLMRFYDPQKGRIMLDGADLRNYRLKDLRNQFGIVPQDPFIFQAELLDNIRVTAPGASRDDIERAMQASDMTGFVSELPRGLNTWLGEGGANLSGGQKQRLAIARALLNNPSILIFDEATSALDNVSEHKIQNSIEKLMKEHTTIIIAHRLTTIRNTDRILVFKDGRIVQQGNYEYLSGVPGMFRTLLLSSQSPF